MTREPIEPTGAHAWIRSNVLGLVAIFIALSGTAFAASQAQQHGAKRARTAALRGKRGPRGFAGPQGPQGAQGPAGAQGASGLSSGPAGGDLTGNYPDPSIAKA